MKVVVTYFHVVMWPFSEAHAAAPVSLFALLQLLCTLGADPLGVEVCEELAAHEKLVVLEHGWISLSIGRLYREDGPLVCFEEVNGCC